MRRSRLDGYWVGRPGNAAVGGETAEKRGTGLARRSRNWGAWVYPLERTPADTNGAAPS
jgi:hypothetical protein